MREPQPYAKADRTIARLNKKAILRFERCEKSIIRNFDELNVFRQINYLYTGLKRDNKTMFISLFIERYLQILTWLNQSDDDDTVDELAEIHITRIFEEPDPVTKYVYETEIDRKRDRLIEAVNAVNGKNNKRAELDKGLRLWAQMTGQYADNISEDANIQALKDSGVKYVRWVSLEDSRVCKTCEDRDGKIYPIGKVPPKPHHRCRCTAVPLARNE